MNFYTNLTKQYRNINVFTESLFNSHLENQKIGYQKKFPDFQKIFKISRVSLYDSYLETQSSM